MSRRLSHTNLTTFRFVVEISRVLVTRNCSLFGGMFRFEPGTQMTCYVSGGALNLAQSPAFDVHDRAVAFIVNARRGTARPHKASNAETGRSLVRSRTVAVSPSRRPFRPPPFTAPLTRRRCCWCSTTSCSQSLRGDWKCGSELCDTVENARVGNAGVLASRMESRTDIIQWDNLKLLPKNCPLTSEWITSDFYCIKKQWRPLFLSIVHSLSETDSLSWRCRYLIVFSSDSFPCVIVCIVHPLYLLPRFPLLHFSLPHFQRPRVCKSWIGHVHSNPFMRFEPRFYKGRQRQETATIPPRSQRSRIDRNQNAKLLRPSARQPTKYW